METKIQREMEACRGELSLLERTSKGINVKTREERKVKRKNKLQSENYILTKKRV